MGPWQRDGSCIKTGLKVVHVENTVLCAWDSTHHGAEKLQNCGTDDNLVADEISIGDLNSLTTVLNKVSKLEPGARETAFYDELFKLAGNDPEKVNKVRRQKKVKKVRRQNSEKGQKLKK